MSRYGEKKLKRYWIVIFINDTILEEESIPMAFSFSKQTALDIIANVIHQPYVNETYKYNLQENFIEINSFIEKDKFYCVYDIKSGEWNIIESDKKLVITNNNLHISDEIFPDKFYPDGLINA